MINKLRQMFVTGVSFLESAEYLFQAKDSFLKGYQTPSIVNYAFACEIFLKSLIKFQNIELKKDHNLEDLFNKLSDGEKEHIVALTMINGGWSTSCFGTDEIKNISNAFVDWRYSYEKSVLHINLGYLRAFCRALREECCQVIFNSIWENCKGKI